VATQLCPNTGAPNGPSSSPTGSQTCHMNFHGTAVPVIKDSSYSEGWSECTHMVGYSPEIAQSKFTLHILSDTPGGFQ
jgi:hypothetical protein